MKEISYKKYLDKVYGCWLGKSISGTIGASFEGRKELFDKKYNPVSIEKMLPNDDLDLQILWLEVLEKKGVYLKSEDLADSFYENCPYAPGEYGIFKKNYARGIRPPFSGTFNNSYYLNGMGCPIRSEIWACICPGNALLAEIFSRKDGILDHGMDSVLAEVFLAAIEAEAFFENDILKLLNKGILMLPKGNKVTFLINNVMEWFEKGYEWRHTRELIIMNYGHPDCTNLYQNMGFILLALLYGKSDFIDTTMLALNCGYDTDCTCATSGAILGIVYGAAFLIGKYGFKDIGYVLGVHTERRSNLISDLAVDTCRVGLTVAAELNKEVSILDAPEYVPVPVEKEYRPIGIIVEYKDIPAIGIGESIEFIVKLKNNTEKTVKGVLKACFPDGWSGSIENMETELSHGKEVSIPLSVSISESIKKLDEKNIIDLVFELNAVERITYGFGIVGAAVWKMYGPFQNNNLEIPDINYWETYDKYITGVDENKTLDILREYHLSFRAEIDRQYLIEPGLEAEHTGYTSPSRDGRYVNIHTDKFSINDYVKMEGPCVIYLERYLYSPEDRNVGILIGNSDAYKLWINDILVSDANEPDWCTNENKHIKAFKFNRGVNRIVFKLARRRYKADFSLIFSKVGLYAEHYFDFQSIIY